MMAAGGMEDYMDEADRQWLAAFNDIPEGAIVEGFVSVISWINPDGSLGHRAYHCLNRPLSHVVGLLEMTQFKMMFDNLETQEEP